jgi:hypothetical protein
LTKASPKLRPGWLRQAVDTEASGCKPDKRSKCTAFRALFPQPAHGACSYIGSIPKLFQERFMRISPIAIQPFVREHGKPVTARGHAEANAASGSNTPAATRTPKPAKDVIPSASVQTQTEPKTTPPGLERALSRLEPARNAGQARVYERISGHIARYLETQTLASSSIKTPVPMTQSPAPEAAASPDTPVTTHESGIPVAANSVDAAPLVVSPASTDTPVVNADADAPTTGSTPV